MVSTVSDHVMVNFSLSTRRGVGGGWFVNGEMLKEQRYKTQVRDYINDWMIGWRI